MRNEAGTTGARVVVVVVVVVGVVGSVDGVGATVATAADGRALASGTSVVSTLAGCGTVVAVAAGVGESPLRATTTAPPTTVSTPAATAIGSHRGRPCCGITPPWRLAWSLRTLRPLMGARSRSSSTLRSGTLSKYSLMSWPSCRAAGGRGRAS